MPLIAPRRRILELGWNSIFPRLIRMLITNRRSVEKLIMSQKFSGRTRKMRAHRIAARSSDAAVTLNLFMPEQITYLA